MRRMIVIVPELTGYASIRHIAVSLRHAAQLIDHVKYMEPQDVKSNEDDTERRRHLPRAPSMRYLVKLAVKCQSAEELGKRLRRRYQRQQQRQGLASGYVTAEAAERLDRLLGQDQGGREPTWRRVPCTSQIVAGLAQRAQPQQLSPVVNKSPTKT
jgi:hypothetical protein